MRIADKQQQAPTPQEHKDFLDLVHLYFPEGLVDHLCGEPSITITPLEGRGQVAVAAGATDDDFYKENPF